MDSIRVVHCANFSEFKFGASFYAIDRKISNGLIKNGHFVYNFSYRDIAKYSTIFKTKKMGIKKANEALLKTIEHIKPNLLLLGHSELITRNTLLKIKNMFPNIKIAMWWVDPFDKIEHIKERVDILDAFFSTTGKKFVDTIFKKFKEKIYFMPNPCDSSIEKFKAFQNDIYTYDLIYVGRKDKRRENFIDNLLNLKNLDIKLFGNSKENFISGINYFDKIVDSKIALNYSRYNGIDLYSSDRIIHLTANGVFTMTPRIPNFTKLFSENEVCYFDDFDDFKDKVYYYLKNEEERKEIAKNGWEKTQKSFNIQRVTKYILEIIFNIEYNQEYEWME